MYGFSDPFSIDHDAGDTGFVPFLRPLDPAAEREAYFLSLPEAEQIELLRESRGSQKSLEQCIENRRRCD